MTLRYRLYGLETESSIDLGALPIGDRHLPRDVEIRAGKIPPIERGAGQWFENRGGVIIVDLPPAGRFLIREGSTIIVDQALAGSAALRWRLLGLAFGALLHQRETLPLHCTALRIGGRAVGLVGASGAGKSTLAAFLHARGHALLVDDVCAIVARRHGPVMVEAGNGLIRLWGDAMAELGTGDGSALGPDIAKFEHRLPFGEEQPFRLEALIEIAEGDCVTLDRLGPDQRLSMCLRHSYCPQILVSLSKRRTNFAQCAGVASQIAGYRLTRPKRFDRMAEIAALIEAEMAALP